MAVISFCCCIDSMHFCLVHPLILPFLLVSHTSNCHIRQSLPNLSSKQLNHASVRHVASFHVKAAHAVRPTSSRMSNIKPACNSCLSSLSKVHENPSCHPATAADGAVLVSTTSPLLLTSCTVPPAERSPRILPMTWNPWPVVGGTTLCLKPGTLVAMTNLLPAAITVPAARRTCH